MTQLQTKRFALAEQKRVVWQIVPEAETPFEALLETGYWAHVGHHLHIGDRIEVNAEDGSYYAELIVQDRGRLFAKVAVLSHVSLTAVEPVETISGFDVKWGGPKAKFKVIRLSDKAVVKDEFESKESAYAWLAQHAKAIAPRAA